MAMSAVSEPWEALVDMVIKARVPGALTDDGHHDRHCDGADGGGLGEDDTPPAQSSDAELSEDAGDGYSDDDASEAGSQQLEAGSDTKSEASFDMSGESSDEVLKEPEPVLDALAQSWNSEEAVLTEKAMWQRALRMHRRRRCTRQLRARLRGRAGNV